MRLNDLPATSIPVPLVCYTLADQERMASARGYFAWQSRLVLPELGNRVLEVGCGVGNFTSLLLDYEIVVGIDIEPDCVDRLKQRYPACSNLYAFAYGVNDPDLLSLMLE
jgi:SAM-dependent methyltransferase